MTLEACPSCSKRISTEAEICPNCAHPLPDGWVEVQKKKTERQAIGCLLVILAIGAFWLVASLLSPPEDNCGSGLEAYLMSKRYVEPRLKAPSTASFAGYLNTKTIKLDCALWHVRSYVDAQNGFGATIRTHYIAIMVFDGKSAWTLRTLKID